MKNKLSIALLILGIMLIFWGSKASDSFGSDLSRVFTGSPTDEAMWLIGGGIVAAVLGGLGLFRGR